MARGRKKKSRKKPGMFLPSIIEALAFIAGASKMVGGSATTSFMQFELRDGLTHTINHVKKAPLDIITGTAIALSPTVAKKAVGIRSKKLIGPIKLI